MAISHKRDTDARRKPLRAALVAGPLAVLATGTAVTLGVLGSEPQTHPQSHQVLAQEAATTGLSRAVDTVSRSDSRLDSRADQRFDEAFHAVQRADRAVDGASRHRWTTAPLNLWTTSGKDAVQDGLLASGTKVLVTGRAADGRVELVRDGLSRWVSAGYLADAKPKPKPEPQKAASTTVARTATAGLSTAPCPDSSVENGLTPGAVLVYRAVCHAYPQITSYGGWDAHGEHSSGKAIDIMTSDQGTGDQIAAFLQAHASELHLYDVIWWDRIWTPERASEGWRDYGDHGSPTANHMDHVHVSVY